MSCGAQAIADSVRYREHAGSAGGIWRGALGVYWVPDHLSISNATACGAIIRSTGRAARRHLPGHRLGGGRHALAFRRSARVPVPVSRSSRSRRDLGHVMIRICTRGITIMLAFPRSIHLALCDSAKMIVRILHALDATSGFHNGHAHALHRICSGNGGWLS
jgi:hypothetical protein